MQPQLPSSPSGTNWITKIDPAWIQKLLACVGYAMTHPRGDGVTILTQDGGTLRARQPPASAPGSAGGYTGYFKAVGSKTVDGETTTLKVKVIDGSNPSAPICGYAIISGELFAVASAELTVTGSGFIFLKATMSGTGESAVISTPVFEFQGTYPALDANIVRALISRVTISDSSMKITQEQHGEIRTDFPGSCDQ